MATPEYKVKRAIKKVLDGYIGKLYYHMPVQNGMGRPTLDFTGCCAGRFFAIEAKAPGNIPTPRQKLTIKTMLNAEGTVFIIDEPTGTDGLQEWIENTLTTFARESWGHFGSPDDE